MVDQQAFKDAMSQLAAAVAIVTTGTADAPHGTTVSAFMSLSLEPVSYTHLTLPTTPYV